MKAMIFAAGRGERMRPLTDSCPKPLLKVRGRPLIVWHILNLVRAGMTDIVINHAHLGHMIEEALGDGSRFGATIAYSAEGTALETAGGIARARHLLGDDPFVAVAGDIYCPHFDYAQALDALQDNDVWGNPHPPDQRDVAWLYLVKNPPHNPQGDFALNNFSIANDGAEKLPFPASASTVRRCSTASPPASRPSWRRSCATMQRAAKLAAKSIAATGPMSARPSDSNN
jgi:MurNAc alpha-1-phosphate uridylyltransferase